MTTKQALEIITPFIFGSQLSVLKTCLRGEEKDFFIEMIAGLAARIDSMPKTMDQDGKGEEAVAYLHYFTPSGDWWITEKDINPGQNQAFGWADLGEFECGYISIVELIAAGVELDLYWTPKTIGAIRKEREK